MLSCVLLKEPVCGSTSTVRFAVGLGLDPDQSFVKASIGIYVFVKYDLGICMLINFDFALIFLTSREPSLKFCITIIKKIERDLRRWVCDFLL